MTDWPDGTDISLILEDGTWHGTVRLPDGTRYDAVGPNRLIVLADLDVKRDEDTSEDRK